MSISRIDKSIAVLNYIIKKKRKRIDDIGRKTVQTESEKIFIGEESEFIREVESLISSTKAEINKNFGKISPHAMQLEEMILGAVILESQSIHKVKSFLLPEHFYSEKHKEIYTAVYNLASANKPIDMATVIIELRRTGKVEVIGGAYVIAEITSKVSSAAHLEYHARIIIEMAIKRAMISICGESLLDAYMDESDCFNVLEKLQTGIKKIEAWIK